MSSTLKQTPKIKSKISIPMFNPPMKGILITFSNLSDKVEHIAIQLGEMKKEKAPLIRIHSECLTGEVFGSQLCDCRSQLQEAFQLIHTEGGYLIYLRQEGRGIGLYNKIEAYKLQEKGLNTYEANHQLGFPDDPRDFKPAVEILSALGLSSIRLLTNNPNKVHQLERHGIQITQQIKTGCFMNSHNKTYIESKKKIGGHTL